MRLRWFLSANAATRNRGFVLPCRFPGLQSTYRRPEPATGWESSAALDSATLPKGADGYSGASLVPAERDPPHMGEMPADIAVQHGHRPADQTESDCCLPPVPSSGRV